MEKTDTDLACMNQSELHGGGSLGREKRNVISSDAWERSHSASGTRGKTWKYNRS